MPTSLANALRLMATTSLPPVTLHKLAVGIQLFQPTAASQHVCSMPEVEEITLESNDHVSDAMNTHAMLGCPGCSNPVSHAYS